MTSLFSHIRAYRAAVWDMFLSAIGCFVLRRCFRLIAAERDGMTTKASAVAYEEVHDPLVYVGAALILLAVAANEPSAPMRVRPI